MRSMLPASRSTYVTYILANPGPALSARASSGSLTVNAISKDEPSRKLLMLLSSLEVGKREAEGYFVIEGAERRSQAQP
jgi:hypothetical protein